MKSYFDMLHIIDFDVILLLLSWPEYYQTVFDVLESDWEKLSAPRLSSELQTLKNKLKQIGNETSTFIGNLEPFLASQNLKASSNHL